MLSIVINNIQKHGFNNFTLTTFYKNRLIKNYKMEKNLNVNIDYITEKNPRNSRLLSLLKTKLKKRIFTNKLWCIKWNNYRSLLDFHIKNKADLTIAVKKYVTENQYGEINTKGIRVKNIIEKPKKYNN